MSETLGFSIRKVPVLPIQLKLMCSTCGGEYVFDDTPLAIHPRVYKHTCSICGAQVTLTECYPRTVYEEVQFEAKNN